MKYARYLLFGDPSLLTHYPRHSQKDRDEQNALRSRYTIDIERQTEGVGKVTKAVKVKFIFHFKRRAHHSFHIFHPALHTLIINYVHFLTNLIWDDPRKVIEESGEKVYGDEEFTEILIYPAGKYEENERNSQS